MSVYRVDLSVGDPKPVFDWIESFVPARFVVRKTAQMGRVTVVFKRVGDAEAFQRRWQPDAAGGPPAPWGEWALPTRAGPPRAPARPRRPTRWPHAANTVRLTAADRRLLNEITSDPWPRNTADPVSGPLEAATPVQLTVRAHSYLPVEEQLKTAVAMAADRIAAGLVQRWRADYPGLSEAQAESLILNWALEEINWDRAGIARRFLMDDPTELPRFMGVASHVSWVLLHQTREFAILDGAALAALGIGDERLLERLLVTFPFPLPDGDVYPFPSYSPWLANAVFGILLDEREQAMECVTRLQARRLPGDTTATVTCLRGILARSPETVAGGLNALKGAIRRRRGGIDPHYKLFDMQLHGLYELCWRVGPELTQGWDPNQGLPWDAAFHRWRRTDRDALEGVDLSALPERQRTLLTELHEPDWAPVVRLARDGG